VRVGEDEDFQNSKIQKPNSKEIPILKIQKSSRDRVIGAWNLELRWILEFGFWNFAARCVRGPAR
jgi:hypothetical protein